MERTEQFPLMRLPVSGWTVRLGRAATDRAALEVYEDDRMADVCVATPVSVSILRGARRNARGDAPWALAWGQLPAGVSSVTARYTGRNGTARPIPAVVLENTYWVAETPGEFTGVTVRAGAAVISGRPRRAGGRRRLSRAPPAPRRGGRPRPARRSSSGDGRPGSTWAAGRRCAAPCPRPMRRRRRGPRRRTRPH